MLTSAALGLLAFLRRIRSIGHNLKPFILRCLIFWPHVLSSLRCIWPLCPGTGLKDAPKKKGGQERPSFPGASGGCKGYSTIYASRDHNRSSEPHLPSESGSTRDLHLFVGPSAEQSPSAPHTGSPVSSIGREPPSPSVTHLSDRHFPGGSTSPIDNADDIPLPHTIPHLGAPLTLTHSRITSVQFTGAPRRSRPQSRPPSPLPYSHPLPQPTPAGSPAASPGPSRSPSPSPSPLPPPQPVPLPQSSVMGSPGSTHMPIPEPAHGTSEGYPRPHIMVHPPPSSQTTEGESQSINFPQSPLSLQLAGAEHWTQDPSDAGSLGLGRVNARHSNEILRPNSPTLSLDPRSISLPYRSHATLTDIPFVDAYMNWSDGKKRSIGLMHSEQVSCYVNKGDVSRDESSFVLRPMEVDLPKYSQAKHPKGWAPATHPGGAVYFYHAEWKIFTDVYMYDSTLSKEIQAFAIYLERTRTTPLPTQNFDLVLDVIIMGKDEIVWAYYYVDHDSKTLFWQDSYDCGDSLLSEVRGVKEASHVKLRLESLYWVHWSLYPTCPDRPVRRFPKEAPKELLGALLGSGMDSLTSKVSTSPYSVAELESMRGFIKEAESFSEDNEGNPHVITSVARLLSFYAQWRFVHFHGQKTTRQDRYKSIYEDMCRNHTKLFRFLSPLFFFFPDAHLRELEKLWTDDIIVEALWRDFMQKLVSEWTDFVLYSTVMLAANVAFLAIPGVIIAPQFPPPANQWIKPSPAQITSSISLVFSIGSIITGLLLIRRNRNMMTKDARRAWYYLHGMNWNWCQFGLEPLAIVFSLTYALLMWSAWGFFVALLIFCFQNMPRTICISVGTAAGIVTVLIVWCIINTWDSEEREDEPDAGREWFLIRLKSRYSSLRRDTKSNHTGTGTA